MDSNAEEFGYKGDGTAEDVLAWAFEMYHPRIALACSFQTTVLVHMVKKISPEARVFAIDTGRLPEETYDCAHEVERRLKMRIEWYFPDYKNVQKLVSEKGMYSFKESLEARKECCAIRKIEPLNRALSGLDAWITGSRRGQSSSRTEIDKIERDELHGGIVKINPIADWTDQMVRDYVIEHRLPYNRLLEKGFSSIGCECCTRSIESGEHKRAGRWWWEGADHKECGMHVRNWNI